MEKQIYSAGGTVLFYLKWYYLLQEKLSLHDHSSQKNSFQISWLKHEMRVYRN
jgi:hypothetical protein